jgi:hypothetical protein
MTHSTRWVAVWATRPDRACGAKAAPLATEGQQQLLVTGVTTEPEKAMGEALQTVIKFASHIGGQAYALGIVVAQGEKGLQVYRDHFVEHRATWSAGFVGRNSRRPKSPHGQHRGEGSARSCRRLYCTAEETSGTRHLAAAPAPRCPRGCGGKASGLPVAAVTEHCGKIPFEIPILRTRACVKAAPSARQRWPSG